MKPPIISSTTLDPGPFLSAVPPVAIFLALAWLIGVIIWWVANGGRVDPGGHDRPRDLQVATANRVWITTALGIGSLLAVAAAIHAVNVLA